jgi:pantothenate synthetase
MLSQSGFTAFSAPISLKRCPLLGLLCFRHQDTNNHAKKIISETQKLIATASEAKIDCIEIVSASNLQPVERLDGQILRTEYRRFQQLIE